MRKNTSDTSLSITTEQLISEKMAELGGLIAGIAHEINTPIAAIRAANSNTTRLLQETLSLLLSLEKKLSEDELNIFYKIITDTNVQSSLQDVQEERKNRQVLTKWLQKLEVADADECADILTDMGITSDTRYLLPLLKRNDCKDIFQIVYDIVVLNRNYFIIDTSIKRVINIVSAIKSYAHHQTTTVMTEDNVIEVIEIILTLYTHDLKQGIKVQKNYSEVPLIKCYPDKLQQVWTNLIHNAIQAMNYRGTLTISVYQENSDLVVKIADTGIGIPKSIQAKIFEPYFTTKERGEGSGIGLSIVKKIIDKHGGSITVTSEPGNTVFQVRLPINNN